MLIVRIGRGRSLLQSLSRMYSVNSPVGISGIPRKRRVIETIYEPAVSEAEPYRTPSRLGSCRTTKTFLDIQLAFSGAPFSNWKKVKYSAKRSYALLSREFRDVRNLPFFSGASPLKFLRILVRALRRVQESSVIHIRSEIRQFQKCV